MSALQTLAPALPPPCPSATAVTCCPRVAAGGPSLDREATPSPASLPSPQAYKAALAEQLSLVDTASIKLLVEPASVRVTATVTYSTPTAAATASAVLASRLSTPSDASSRLGVPVASVELPSMVVQAYTPPLAPPSSAAADPSLVGSSEVTDADRADAGDEAQVASGTPMAAVAIVASVVAALLAVGWTIERRYLRRQLVRSSAVITAGAEFGGVGWNHAAAWPDSPTQSLQGSWQQRPSQRNSPRPPAPPSPRPVKVTTTSL